MFHMCKTKYDYTWNICLTLAVYRLSDLVFYYYFWSKILLKCCCCCYQFIYGVPRKSWKSKFWNLCKCTWSLYLNEIAHLNLHLMNNVTIKFILSISISDRCSQSRDAVRNSRHLDWNTRFFIWHTRYFWYI